MSYPPRRRLSQTLVKQPVFCLTAEDGDDSYLNLLTPITSSRWSRLTLLRMTVPQSSTSSRRQYPAVKTSGVRLRDLTPLHLLPFLSEKLPPSTSLYRMLFLPLLVLSLHLPSSTSRPTTGRRLRPCLPLEKELVWTPEKLELYWPEVDNFRREKKRRDATKPTGKQASTQVSYYWCRLYHGNTVSEGHGLRNKKLRKHEACGMKLKLLKTFSVSNAGILAQISVSLHQDKGKPCASHCHDSDYIDKIKIKINSEVRTAAATEVAEGYRKADINRNLNGTKHTPNLTALTDVGGRHMTLKHIRNAGREWTARNPDLRAIGSNETWKLQWESCLES